MCIRDRSTWARERLYACVTMFIGVFFYTYAISSLATLLTRLDSRHTMYTKKLNILLGIKKEFHLGNERFARIRKALRDEVGEGGADDFKPFLEELPQNIRNELGVIMHEDILNAIPFFQNKPPSFISLVGPMLRIIKVQKREYIFMERDPAEEMFFIRSGKVAYVLPQYNNFRFLKIKSGYFFGEVDLLFNNEIRMLTAMAVKDCELYVLNKKDFKKVFIMEFRDIGLDLIQIAYERKRRTYKSLKEALEFCQETQQTMDQVFKNQKTKVILRQESEFRETEGERVGLTTSNLLKITLRADQSSISDGSSHNYDFREAAEKLQSPIMKAMVTENSIKSPEDNTPADGKSPTRGTLKSFKDLRDRIFGGGTLGHRDIAQMFAEEQIHKLAEERMREMERKIADLEVSVKRILQMTQKASKKYNVPKSEVSTQTESCGTSDADEPSTIEKNLTQKILQISKLNEVDDLIVNEMKSPVRKKLRPITNERTNHSNFEPSIQRQYFASLRTSH
eukprot:TRINITY_DN7853_c0_g1_i4.p1 TRINITY_DN7853_c0_g1~~TRINITY_DN7853_c0_g1_i4.p1  ORF type:complete len:509 (+),score=76.90 TRINITY_DN7853_c0_g1_i4:64-1590(+)